MCEILFNLHKYLILHLLQGLYLRSTLINNKYL